MCHSVLLLFAGAVLDIPPGYLYAVRALEVSTVVVTRYLGYTTAIRSLHTLVESTLLHTHGNQHVRDWFKGVSCRMGRPGWKLVLENGVNDMYGLQYNLSTIVDTVRLDPVVHKLTIGPSAAEDLGGAGLALGRVATLLAAVKQLHLKCLHSDVFSKFYNIVCSMTGVS